MTTAQRLTEQALARGRTEGEAKIVLHVLDRRFGPLSAEAAERVRQATPAQLELWADRLITATTLDDVFH